MITVSVCMIVKNEEKILSECLDCLKEFADEIIIVDTGSTDKTKEIAGEYTEQIYDFCWVDDFAAARNFSFSKAKMDYIYVADADELVDQTNQKRLMVLKQVLLPEIEIVQMKYTNQLQNGATYNYDVEYRGKLFKRIRTFHWIDPIHETININPVIYDSEVEIIHNPHENHAQRDFELFQKIIERGECLSTKLINLYARELFISGKKDNFLEALSYYRQIMDSDSAKKEEFQEAACVVARAARLDNDIPVFFNCAFKLIAGDPCSEICCELGEYYMDQHDYKEATLWFFNACFECESILNIHYGGDYPLIKLAECHNVLGNQHKSLEYLEKAEEWRKQHSMIQC